MTKFFQITLLSVGLICFSQNKSKFQPGVEIIQNDKVANYESPQSILFVFKGHTHIIHNFLDLQKNIKKTFKKNMKRNFRKFQLDFNYNLNGENSFEEDLKKIPSKVHNEKNYEAVCYITLTDMEGWDHHLIEKRKLKYVINLQLKNKNLKEILKSKLLVNSFYTIATENKKSSKLIFQTIMGDN